ncbi:MAG: protein TolR [Syntrophobacteraceae bacterium]|jgi:biopolymer transport protein TolR|nr:protein TolR [Syntrophobacteraceae bacterium]
MGMQVGGNSGSSRSMLSEINVTPFVDVMLVLLIIFMVTAPMMTQGIDVKLPESSAPAIPSDEERLVVTVHKDRNLFINEHPVNLDVLGEKLLAMIQNRPSQRGVFLRADESVPYGVVMQVMSVIRQAGIDQIGMVTEPSREPAAKGAKK